MGFHNIGFVFSFHFPFEDYELFMDLELILKLIHKNVKKFAKTKMYFFQRVEMEMESVVRGYK